MPEQNQIDEAILRAIEETIDEAIESNEEGAADFARKFRQRMKLTLNDQIQESDLIDLIDAVPFGSESLGE